MKVSLVAALAVLVQLTCKRARAQDDLPLFEAPGFELVTNLSKAQGLNNIIIPFYALPAFTDVSPTGGDVTLLLRQTALISNAIYDATAPYMDTAVGIYSRLPRQTPPPEDNNKVLNTALLYSVYRVLLDVLPTRAVRWRRMMSTVGLDPDNDSTTPNGPAGIGNAAGKAVVAGRANDGANARGLRDRKYNPRPFEDYTGYVPVNTPDEVVDPSRWQPYVSRRGVGIYAAQRFVTPQWALVEPYFLGDDTAKYKVPPPVKSNYRGNRPGYKEQVDAVLKASAELTDTKKAAIEFFNNKINIGNAYSVPAAQSGAPLLKFIQGNILSNVVLFDSMIPTWQNKNLYDAVRPFTAIRTVYGNNVVTAWGGPGKGTVNDIPANNWESWTGVADHSEYPSASACLCEALAAAMKLYFDTPKLNFTRPVPAGSSRNEPGVPAQTIFLSYTSWDGFVKACGQSRIDGGLHFPAAVEVTQKPCSRIGEAGYEYWKTLMDGTAPARGPSQGMPVSGDYWWKRK